MIVQIFVVNGTTAVIAPSYDAAAILYKDRKGAPAETISRMDSVEVDDLLVAGLPDAPTEPKRRGRPRRASNNPVAGPAKLDLKRAKKTLRKRRARKLAKILAVGTAKLPPAAPAAPTDPGPGVSHSTFTLK